MQKPLVSVVIVSYNVAGLLEKCLDSLYSYPSENYYLEVIVVDNDSRDDSVGLVREKYPQAQLIANTANYGFPTACNQGWHASIGEYVFFFNPDANLAPGALDILLAFMQANPKAGIVGPLLRYGDGAIQSSRRRFPSVGLALVESTILQRYRPFKNLSSLQKFFFDDIPLDLNHAQEVDWLVGAAFVVRREILESLNGLDERFFMYSEEMDFCKRAKKAGWQVWFVPQAVVTHLEGRSSGQDVPRRHINFNTSKVSYFRKHYGVLVGWGLRQFLLATYVFQYVEEGTKLLLRHKPQLRRERLALIRQVLASRLLPRPFPRPSFSQGICFISAEYPPQPGGVGDYTATLATELAKTERVSVISGVGSDKLGKIATYPLVKKWGWGSLPKIARHLLAYPADAVNIQYQTGAYRMHPAINFLPLYLRWRLGRTRPKIVTTFHDLRVPYLFPKAGRVRDWVNRLLLKNSDAAVLTNEEDYIAAQKWVAPDKLRLIPIGSNIPALPPSTERAAERLKWGVAPQEFLVGYFGLLNHSKGVDILLEALAQLEPGCKLLIIGGVTGDTDTTNRPYARQLEEKIRQLGLQNSIIWTGYLSAEDTSEALYSLDAVALPFRDGVSLRRGSLLAALAHALPVVSTNPISPPTPLKTSGEYANMQQIQLLLNQSVILIDRENPQQLADALANLRDNPALRLKLGEAAQELSRYFAWDTFASAFREVFVAC